METAPTVLPRHRVAASGCGYGDDAGRPILFFTGFAGNQRRMLYQRERASGFACPPGFARTPAGPRPAGDATQDGEPAARDARDEVARRTQAASTLRATRSRFGRDQVDLKIKIKQKFKIKIKQKLKININIKRKAKLNLLMMMIFLLPPCRARSAGGSS